MNAGTWTYNNAQTGLGFSVIVDEGKIIGIRDNMALEMQARYQDSPYWNSELVTQQSAVARALETLREYSTELTVTKQFCNLYFDVADSTYFYRVLTVYTTPEGSQGVLLTINPYQ